MHVIAILHNMQYSLLVSRVDTCTPSSPLSLMLLQPFQTSQCYHEFSFLILLLGSSLFPDIFEPWSFKSHFCNPYLGSRWCVCLQQGVINIPKQCILILQSLYICQEPRVITTQDILILQSVRLYLTNQRLWGCIICFLIHQVICYLLQISLDKYVLYCLLQSVYASSLFISRLSIMNHGLWGCILRLHHIHQDRTTMSLCFITHKVFNFYLCPVQDQVMIHQHILFLQSLLVPSVIVTKEEARKINLPSSKAITVSSLLQQEAYKHNSVLQLLKPTSSLVSEPYQYACCSQDKSQTSNIVSTLKVLFPSLLMSMSSSLYLMSYPSVTLHNVSTLLMLSFLVLILLSTAKQEVEQVGLHQSIQIRKHCVQNGIFYIFILILWLGYFHRIIHCLRTIGNYNPCSIFLTTRIISMIGGFCILRILSYAAGSYLATLLA